MDQKTTSTEANPLSLKEVPVLPLRAGRHLTVWVAGTPPGSTTEDAPLGTVTRTPTLRRKQPSLSSARTADGSPDIA